MQHNNLDRMRVAILLSDDFELVEMTAPREALEQVGATTMIVSPTKGTVTGMNHDEKVASFKVDLPLEQANPNDFDAVLLPGGALNADALRMNQQAQQFIKQIDQSGKPIAVICHAPWLLVSADCVRGRTMTSWQTIQDDIRNAGGNWVDQQVVRDRNWVSSRGPQDIPVFNPAMIELFEAYSQQKQQQRQNTISA